jgi:hypothetical protein
LPAKSKSLGFKCYACGRDSGSIQPLGAKKTYRRNSSRRRTRSARNESSRQPASRRDGLKPVENALKNKIMTHTEESYSNRLVRIITQLRREGWRFLPFSAPLPDSERQKLEEYSSKLHAIAEERRKQLEEEQLTYSKWEVIQKIDDVDPRIYEFMKKMGPMVNIEVKNNDTVIKWNPVKLIRSYRRVGDPIASLWFPWFFYEKVLSKHPYIITERLAPEFISLTKRGVEVFNEYRHALFDQNWKYTLYEWFWIVAYAKAEGIGKTLTMLKAIDGQKVGRISHRHIKKMLERVIRFWEDFHKYCPYLFKFIELILAYIRADPELAEKYEKLREQSRNENIDYLKGIRGTHIDDLIEQLTGTEIPGTQRTKRNVSEDRAVRTGQERIRIHHSNPNYQKELEEYKKGLRSEKLRKKKSCGPFDPSILPIEVRAKLHNEKKVPLW